MKPEAKRGEVGPGQRRALAKWCWTLVLVFLLQLGWELPPARAEAPMVRAVLFWAETCPYCHEVLEKVFPPLQKQYGSQLEIYTIELSDPARYELWAGAMQAFGVPRERQGVPMLFIGDKVLVGSLEIPRELPSLIEEYLKAGGVGYPAIPNLTVVLQAMLTPVPTPPSSTPVPTATPQAAPIHLAYFYLPGCQDCDRVNLDLNYLKGRYPQLVVHAFDVHAEAALAEWLAEQAGVPESKRLIAPSVFLGDEALVADEVGLASLEELIARHRTKGAEAFWEGWASSPSTSSGIIGRFRSFSAFTVLAAGLVDGLNPCAFATVVFLISYLAMMGRQRRELLAVGVAFTLGVFLTYLGVGFGVLKFLTSLPFLGVLGRWVYGLTAAMCLVLAAFSFHDWAQARQGKVEAMRLRLPPSLRRWVNRVIREGAGRRASALVALVTGAVVSLIELACTGQVYLPTIIFVLGVPELQARARLFLVLYNLMFIVPLVVVFLLAFFGTTSRQLGLFIGRRAGAIKLATAVLFLALAGWLVVALF